MINKKYFSIKGEDLKNILKEKNDEIVLLVKEMIDSKLESVKAALESFTTSSIETGDDDTSRMKNLYNFWSLSRAKERFK